MIVLVSHSADAHANEVHARLVRSGADAVVLDTAAFPREIGLAVSVADGEGGNGHGWRAEASVDGRRRDLADARVVWWRRPLPFLLHDEITRSEDRAFAYGECHAAITGLWSCLDAHWINDPERDLVASRKLIQLKVAAGLGLRVPRTCVTNDPARAARFIEAEGERGTIYKAFSATEQAWRETRLLRPDEQDRLANIRFAPVIFQEFIPATVDVRITVIGDELFPAAIRSQETRYPHDFRMDLEAARIEPHRLPEEVEAQLRTLMATFGLVYGAIDMRLTPEGEYVFLEVNPSGQWLFVEVRTQQPITDALCGYLLGHENGVHVA